MAVPKLLDETYQMIEVLSLWKMEETSGEPNKEVLLVFLKAGEGTDVSLEIGYFQFFIDVPVLLLEEGPQLSVLIGVDDWPGRFGRESMTG